MRFARWVTKAYCFSTTMPTRTHLSVKFVDFLPCSFLSILPQAPLILSSIILSQFFLAISQRKKVVIVLLSPTCCYFLQPNIFGIFVDQDDRLLATAIRYAFKLPTYIQEPLVIGRRGYIQRDLTFRRQNFLLNFSTLCI